MVLSIHFNDPHKLQEALVVKVVGDSKLMTVTREVVPLVDVNAILFIGNDLTDMVALIYVQVITNKQVLFQSNMRHDIR